MGVVHTGLNFGKTTMSEGLEQTVKNMETFIGENDSGNAILRGFMRILYVFINNYNL